MTHGWIKTDLTVKPSPPYQYEVLFMTPIYLIKNTVFAAMKHFFTNKWRMWGPRSLRAYLRTKTSISGCHGPRSVSRPPCLLELDTDWPLAGKVIVPGA